MSDKTRGCTYLNHTIALASLFLSLTAHATIKSETIDYKDGSTVLSGVLYFDDAVKDPKAGVVVVHEWMGLNEYSKRRAKEMAELGYVALAADIYGKGVRAKDMKEAGELATKYKSDRALLRGRGKAAFDLLARRAELKNKKIVAMGYCFGGTTVLEMARSGLPLAGVVSFHGGLSTPNAKDASQIKAKVLALHGAIDPYVPADEVSGFMKEMNDAKVDYQFVSYSQSVHGFTNPDNGSDISKGAAYNAAADARSFVAMKSFFDEVIK